MTVTVVKVGGAIVEDAASLTNFLDTLARLPRPFVLVHGGGSLVTRTAESLGIAQTMIEGRRVTDARTLDILVMILGGLTNKSIVAGLAARGVAALGMTGPDAGIIRSVKHRDPSRDYGFVGDITDVDGRRMMELMTGGATPLSLVLAPVTHDGAGQLLNTNADKVASAVASALGTVADVDLVYCFDKDGVLMDVADDASVVSTLTRAEMDDLYGKGVIVKGMVPKLNAAFAALDAGVRNVRIQSAATLGTRSGTAIVRTDA